jgi:tungstate transport system substrate-binding protein
MARSPPIVNHWPPESNVYIFNAEWAGPRVPLGILIVALLSGCNPPATRVLRLATTTSARDSGLLEEILPTFEQSSGCRVDVIAVGTGAALRLGEAGDVDVLVVHAREAELKFMSAGFGQRHEEFMLNHFVILGPPDDPARIKHQGAVSAFSRLAAGPHVFVSRGDESGTHQREKRLWKLAKQSPDSEYCESGYYLESGQGMGPTLVIASEKRGYVLSDMGTYLNFRDRIELVPFVSDDDELQNPYAVMTVSEKVHDGVNAGDADLFLEFLISPATQNSIANFRKQGERLFQPTRISVNSSARYQPDARQ